MRNISRRIDAMEKSLAIGQHKKAKTVLVIIRPRGRKATLEDKEILGLHETWITYQEQKQSQIDASIIKSGRIPGIVKIKLDVDKEYQARKQLKATKNN